MSKSGYSRTFLRQVASMSVQQDLRLYQAGIKYSDRVSNVPNKELFEDSLSVLIEAAMELALRHNMSLIALITAVVTQAQVIYQEGGTECQS